MYIFCKEKIYISSNFLVVSYDNARVVTSEVLMNDDAEVVSFQGCDL
jgi:hypothetical protein